MVAIPKCIVPKCNNTKKHCEEAAFHQFPSNHVIRDLWVKELIKRGLNQKQIKIDGKYHCVCSLHFTEDSYTRPKRLKHDAVPTVFPCNQEDLPVTQLRAPAAKRPNELLYDMPMPLPDNGESLVKLSRSSVEVNDDSLREAMDHGTIPAEVASPNDEAATEIVSSNDGAHERSEVTEKDHQKQTNSNKNKTNLINPPVRRLPSRRYISAPAKIKMLQQSLRRERTKNKKLKAKINENSDAKKLVKKFYTIWQDAQFEDPLAIAVCEQIQNYKKNHGNRWSSSTIANSIIARARGPSCYEFIRNSNFLTLPSNDTLRSYEGSIEAGEVGVTDLIIRRLELEGKSLNEKQRMGSLIIDEMTISPEEIYERNTQTLVGKVNVDGITTVEEDSLANRMLGFVFSGFATHYSIPVAYFFVNKLTGQQLRDLSIHVITKLEKSGFRVVRVVADNASVNVAFFKLLHDAKTLTHVVRHPIQEPADEGNTPMERPLFLSFDYCHILKNVRNQHLDREFLINDEEVSSRYAKLIHEKQKHEILVPVRNLSLKVINPNTIERQKVAPAMIIFRPELTAAIEMYHEYKEEGFDNVAPTVNFLKTFNKWISINDICSTSEFVRKRLPYKKPFYSVDDERLDWLHDFMQFLSSWRQQIEEAIQKIPKDDVTYQGKVKKLRNQTITKETHDALILTTQSLIACVKYLLDKDYYFVLTRKFSSDQIEQLFGAIRQMTGGNFKCNALAATQALGKVVKTGIAMASKNGNVRLEKMKKGAISLVASQNSKRSIALDVLKKLPKEDTAILNQLERAPVPVDPSPTVATAALIAGYVILVLEEREVCEECVGQLRDVRNCDKAMTLVRLLDRGGLHYPTTEFLCRLWTVYQFVSTSLPALDKTKYLKKGYVEFIMPYIRDCPTFKCELSSRQQHQDKLLKLVLNKFLSPLLVNKANISKRNLQSVSLVTTSKNRRVGTLTT